MNTSRGLVDKIQQLALGAESFAYLSIDDRGMLLDKGGELSSLDLPDWRNGENILDQAIFLHGSLPLSSDHESIISYQLTDSCTIDIHLFKDVRGVLILMIDRSREVEEEARKRQQRNESKLRERYSRARDEPE